jgi:hypothetical protein
LLLTDFQLSRHVKRELSVPSKRVLGARLKKTTTTRHAALDEARSLGRLDVLWTILSDRGGERVREREKEGHLDILDILDIWPPRNS